MILAKEPEFEPRKSSCRICIINHDARLTRTNEYERSYSSHSKSSVNCVGKLNKETEVQ